MIKGISHITFIVKDLKKSAKLLEKVFDAKEVYDSKSKNFSLAAEKFFKIGKIWVAIMQGKSLKEKTYNHFAFDVAEKDFAKYENRIKELGLEIKLARSRVKGEGRSIYFYDYDNHLFEIHSGNMQKRVKYYKGYSTLK
jgi:catechol 2,3-dioxygenase-like lactoylglutathione lyase family enzyme